MMRNVGSLIMSIAVLTATLVAQRVDPNLQSKLEALVRDFKGDAGAYVYHVRTGITAAVNADTLFPTASMIKVPILLGLFDRINRGELKYNQEMLYRDSLKYDDGITGSLRDSTRIPLCELVTLMICFSDNTASLWLQQLAGTGNAINAWLEANGFHKTRVNSRTRGREEFRSMYGWGMTTPREMARLLLRINEGTAVSHDASEEMHRILGTIHWTGEALSQIPPAVKTMSKQGSVDQSKSEVVLVHAPSGDYVFCVITKNQRDTRWTPDNEGLVLLRSVSRMLWDYFEPTSEWTPSADRVRWEK